MSRILDNPDPAHIKKWGELGYVSAAERERILALSYGQFRPECEYLKKEIKEWKKKRKNKRLL